MRFSLSYLVAAVMAPLALAQELSLLEIAAADPELATLVQAIGAGGLVETLSGDGPFTVFAPGNLAFVSLAAAYPDLATKVFDPVWQPHLVNILTYHVYDGAIESSDLADYYTMISGRNITIDATTTPFSITDEVGGVINVVTADVSATNGVAHVVDALMLPGWLANTVYSIAGSAPDQFSTLQSLIDRVGLAETLSGYGADSTGFTVFAPINAAFVGVDATALTDEEVTAILLYHAVPGPYTAANLVSGPLTTVGGATIMIDVSDAGIKVNDAMVVFPDILANNGVVHVIMGLLTPPEGTTSTPGDSGSMAPMTPTGTDTTATAPAPAPASSATSTPVSVLFAAIVVLCTAAWM